MEAALLLLSTLTVLILAVIRLRLGLYAFLLLYGSYPRGLAVGLGPQSFAFSLQFTMGLVLALVWVLRLVYREVAPIRGLQDLLWSRGITASLVAFSAVKLLSTVNAGSFDAEVLSAVANDLLFGVVLLLVTTASLRSPRHMTAALVSLTFGALVNLFIACFEVGSGTPFLWHTHLVDAGIETGIRGGFMRTTGSFYGPILFAYYLLALIPLMNYVWRYHRRRWVRACGGLASVLAIPILYTTGTRGALVLLAVMYALLAILFLTRRLEAGARLAICAVALVVMGTVSPMILDFVNRSLLGVPIDVEGDRSATSRIDQFYFTWASLEGRELLGGGQKRNVIKAGTMAGRNIDNFYLSTALQAGLLGLLSLLLFFYAVATKAVKLTTRAANLDYRTLARSLRNCCFVIIPSAAFFAQPYHIAYLYVVAGMLVVVDAAGTRTHGGTGRGVPATWRV